VKPLGFFLSSCCILLKILKVPVNATWMAGDHSLRERRNYNSVQRKTKEQEEHGSFKSGEFAGVVRLYTAFIRQA
jgi:hypothetical protein